MSERSDMNDAADAVNEATTVAMPQVADEAGRNEASDTVSLDTVPMDTVSLDTSVLDTAVLGASACDGAANRSPRPDGDRSRPSASNRSEARPADRSVPPSVPSYVQVPREAPMPPKVMRKRGPSGATIVFAVFMLLVGGVSLAMGLYFPLTSFNWFTMDPRVAIAMGCAALGGLLIVVAIVWSLATIIHSHKQDRADRAQAAQSADAGMKGAAA